MGVGREGNQLFRENISRTFLQRAGTVEQPSDWLVLLWRSYSLAPKELTQFKNKYLNRIGNVEISFAEF